MNNNSNKKKVGIIAALIGAAGLIITALITGGFGLASPKGVEQGNEIGNISAKGGDNTNTQSNNVNVVVGQEAEAPKGWDMTITVTDGEGVPLRADLYITNVSTGTELPKNTTDEHGVLLLRDLAKDRYTVRAESAGFTQTFRDFDQHNSALRIEMKKEPPPPGSPFNMASWGAWGGLAVSSRGDNTVVFNGDVQTAGYVHEYIDRGIAGRTLILVFSNADQSQFNGDRMLKMTVNQSDRLLRPLNISVLMNDEYLPHTVERAEYLIPPDFDGKLGMVFYNAKLKDLRISAFIKD